MWLQEVNHNSNHYICKYSVRDDVAHTPRACTYIPLYYANAYGVRPVMPLLPLRQYMKTNESMETLLHNLHCSQALFNTLVEERFRTAYDSDMDNFGYNILQHAIHVDSSGCSFGCARHSR